MGLAAAIGVGAVASIGGALITSHAASSAANTQASAEQSAAAQMERQYLQTRSDLLPYNTAGQTANAGITAMGNFSFNPTMEQLEATPGYKFTLGQGLESTENGYAARGLGTSGAAMKGATDYATGLASTTYQSQFDNALAGYTTNLSKLQGQAQLGENAAAQTGAYGTTTAANIGQTAVGAANAQAAGTIGSANALAGGLSGASNALLASRFFGSSGGSIYGTSPAVYNTGIPTTYGAGDTSVPY